MASRTETPPAYHGVAPGTGPSAAGVAPPLVPAPSEAESEGGGAPRRGVAQLAATGVVNSYEGLDDDDWHEMPFVPPSLPLATELVDEDVFGSKQLGVCSTGIDTMSTLGVGMGIWFRFLCIACAFFVVCTILSAPSFMIAYQGERIARTDELRAQDAFGFSLVSVGNVGPSVSTALAACPSNVSCRTLSSPVVADVELPLPDTTLVLVASDAAVWVALLGFLFAFARTIRHVENQIADNNIETSSYSVMVTGLPKDVTAAEVRAHFDRLYNLRERDWTFRGFCCGCCMAKHRGQLRPPIPKPVRNPRTGEFRAARAAAGGTVTTPVLNATNTGDPSYLRSWVAEVTLAHPNGSLVAKYRAMQGRLQRIHRLRAAVKLYSEGSPFADKRKRAKAAAVLRGAELAMADLDARLTSRFNSDVVAAFVIFNTEQSRQRALFDYAWSRSWCLRLCQPTPLRLRRDTPKPGESPTPIIVQEAPDPSDVLWENLEASGCERRCRQVLSTTAMLFIIAISLVFLIVAQRLSKQVQSDVPSIAVCEQEALQVGAGPNASLLQYSIVRDRSIDSTCPGSSRGLYVADTSTGRPAPMLSGYDPASCTSLCVDPAASEPVCSGPGLQTNFSKSGLVPCFCVASLTKAQSEGVLLTALSEVSTEELCVEFAAATLSRNSVLALASLAVVIVNVLLRYVAHSLTMFERHVSVGALQSAKVIKILALTFLNTAVITFLVNVKFNTDGVPSWLASLLGDVEGFEPRWFAVAGSSIVLTMALNVVTLNIGVILRSPCLMFECCCSRQSARVQPAEGAADAADDLVHAPGPMQLPEGAAEMSPQERLGHVRHAERIRVAQSSLGCWDRCCARHCACCGPQQACGCLVSACNPLPQSLQCWCCCRGARARAAVTQAELAAMVDMPVYDMAQRWPLALNTFFVTVAYGAGMPILYPIAALAFLVSFYVERCSLLRFTKQPDIMDSSLARLSLRVMPVAVVLHSVVTIFIFSDPSLLESRSVFAFLGAATEAADVRSWYQEQLDSAGTDASVTQRFERESVVIPLVLLLVFLLGWATRCIISARCRGTIRSCLVVVCCGRPCVDTRQATELRDIPPFTGLYWQPLPSGVHHTVSDVERADGWRLQRDINRRHDRKAQRKIKVWTATGAFNGKVHRKGERMLTWETIADVGIASYNPAANPNYAPAFLALESAVDRTKALEKERQRAIALRAALLRAQMSEPDAPHAKGGEDTGGRFMGASPERRAGAEGDQYGEGGEYEEGEYDEGEYDEGEYDEGEYDEGEYDEGGYDEGEYGADTFDGEATAGAVDTGVATAGWGDDEAEAKEGPDGTCAAP